MAVSRTIFGTAIQKGETYKYVGVVKDEAGVAVNITSDSVVSALTCS